MAMRSLVRNSQGFTLIELVSVLVIMGVLGSVGVHKFGILTDTAGLKALESSITELEIRETLTWYNIKMSDEGWTSDDAVFNQVDKNLGPDFIWDSGPATDGGVLHLKGYVIPLKREPSTVSESGRWTFL
jgi:prepilin-type N-terminal cleavage/methylation domain-containing protein